MLLAKGVHTGLSLLIDVEQSFKYRTSCSRLFLSELYSDLWKTWCLPWGALPRARGWGIYSEFLDGGALLIWGLSRNGALARQWDYSSNWAGASTLFAPAPLCTLALGPLWQGRFPLSAIPCWCQGVLFTGAALMGVMVWGGPGTLPPCFLLSIIHLSGT